MRILLIDDDEDDFVIFRDLLTTARYRYDLTWVSTFGKAREIIGADAHYDIAFVDYRLGEGTGLELLRDASDSEWPTPIVLLTGLDDEQLDEAAASAGAADYIPKPDLTSALIERTIRYVRARAQIANRALLSEHKFRSMFEQANDAIVIVDGQPDSEGVITMWNDAARRLFGFTQAEAENQRISSLLHLQIPGTATLQLPTQGRIEGIALRRDGRELTAEISSSTWPSELGRQTCFIIRDVSERTAAHQRLRDMASRDHLTGLANRGSFLETLKNLISQTGSSNRVAVLYLDLDGFKRVNDQLGHAVGDDILRQTADRIRRLIRSEDIAARLGGDEFTVAIPAGCTEHEVLSIAARCLAELRQPYEVRNQSLQVGASIGVAFSEVDDSPDTLLEKADNAMYSAKRSGKDRVFCESSERPR